VVLLIGLGIALAVFFAIEKNVLRKRFAGIILKHPQCLKNKEQGSGRTNNIKILVRSVK